MGAIVTADMIVVPGEPDGLVYLAKGAPVPSYVTKEKLKELEEFGLIEIEKPSRSRSTAKKADDKSDDADTGNGDGDDGSSSGK